MAILDANRLEGPVGDVTPTPALTSVQKKATAIAQMEDTATTAYQSALTAPAKTQAQVDAINAGVKAATESTGNVYNPANALTVANQPTLNPSVVSSNNVNKNYIAPPKKDPVYDALVAAMGVYNIKGLAATLEQIRMDYPDITSADMLTLLRNDSRYNGEYLNRFSGNKLLAAQGKPMIDEKTYLQNEIAYGEMFKSYGLDKYFSNTNQYAQLIGGSVSVTEATNRVSAVFNRVLNADSSTLDVYKRYYSGLGTQDIVAALLDPKETMPAIERKITSAEIGGAAVRQGLDAYQAATDIQSKRYSNVMGGTIGSDVIAASGETGAQATTDYQKIAKEQPLFEKLSAISGKNLQQYGQQQAEQDVILGLASAGRAKQAQIDAENARMKGSAGVAPGAFSTGYLRKSANAGLI